MALECGKMGFQQLRGREKADVAVIGGGLSGMATALWLSRAGLKVSLVEAQRIGWGASGRNTGIVAPCQRAVFAELERNTDSAAAQAYAHTHVKAIQSVIQLSAQTDHRFKVQNVPGMMIAKKEEKQVLKCEADAMLRAGLQAEWSAEASAGSDQTMIGLSHVYVLDPSLYLDTLVWCAGKCGVRIHEHSRVTAVETDAVYTEEGSIQAPYIVVSTGYPIVNMPGWYFIRLEQKKMALSANRIPCSEVRFAWDGSSAYRPYAEGALVRTIGGNAENEIQEGNANAMECFTPDGLPYIGPYSAKTPNMFIAAGYGGNGIAGSVVAAHAIASYILGLPSDGYEIYSPRRKIKDFSVPMQIGGRYLKGLFGGLEKPRCSHMGCRLAFNPVSRLWECPCHGSRFDDIGRVVNAPAVRPAQLRNRK